MAKKLVLPEIGGPEVTAIWRSLRAYAGTVVGGRDRLLDGVYEAVSSFVEVNEVTYRNGEPYILPDDPITSRGLVKFIDSISSIIESEAFFDGFSIKSRSKTLEFLYVFMFAFNYEKSRKWIEYLDSKNPYIEITGISAGSDVVAAESFFKKSFFIYRNRSGAYAGSDFMRLFYKSESRSTPSNLVVGTGRFELLGAVIFRRSLDPLVFSRASYLDESACRYYLNEFNHNERESDFVFGARARAVHGHAVRIIERFVTLADGEFNAHETSNYVAAKFANTFDGKCVALGLRISGACEEGDAFSYPEYSSWKKALSGIEMKNDRGEGGEVFLKYMNKEEGDILSFICKSVN